MAIMDGLGLGSDSSKALAAVLLIQSATNSMDVFSALNSSPWTAQSFGADEEKRDACLEYVHHSLVFTAAFNGAAAVLAKSWWPVIGWAFASAYMYWLYIRALQRAVDSHSTGWGT